MALDAIIDNLDAVPEGVRGEYTAIADGDHKGKFMLDVKPGGGFALDNVDGLKASYARTKTDLETSLNATKAELSTAQSALGGYSGLKMKPSEIANSLKKLAELEKIDPDSEADKKAQVKIDAFKERAQKDFDEKLSTEQKRSTGYRSQIETLIRDNALQAAIGKADGVTEILTPVLSGRVKVVENGGTLQAVVIDNAGNPAQTFKNNELVNMTVDDLVQSYKTNETFGGAFKASGRHGTGAPPNGGGGSQAGAVKMTSKEWIAKTSAAEPAARKQLFAEAAAGKYIIE